MTRSNPEPTRGPRPDMVFWDDIEVGSIGEGDLADYRRQPHSVDANGFCADCDGNVSAPTTSPWISIDDIRWGRDDSREVYRREYLNRWTSETDRELVEPVRQEVAGRYARVRFTADTEVMRTQLESMQQTFECVSDRLQALGELVGEPRYEERVQVRNPWDEDWRQRSTERDRDRAWATEVNRRAADDEVLASQRREAMFRENRAERTLNAWMIENEFGGQIERRIEHGDKIVERPTSFSWLDGPVKKTDREDAP